MAISFLLFGAAFLGACLALVGVVVLLVTKENKVSLPLIAIGLSVLTAAIGIFADRLLDAPVTAPPAHSEGTARPFSGDAPANVVALNALAPSPGARPDPSPQ